MFRLSFMFIALLTAGCVSLDPHYDRPAAPVPATLPGAHGESTAVVGDWQKVVNDARLKKVVSIALNSNRDVQKALADIEAARAQYGETRASLFPTVDAELSHTRSKTVASGLRLRFTGRRRGLQLRTGLVRQEPEPVARGARNLACQRIHRAEYPADDDCRFDHRLGDAGDG